MDQDTAAGDAGDADRRHDDLAADQGPVSGAGLVLAVFLVRLR
jgi:hypothetical protein